MSTTTPRSRSRRRFRVLQATPTSAHFQEALRLCRHHQEDHHHHHHPSDTDDETSHPADSSISNNEHQTSYTRTQNPDQVHRLPPADTGAPSLQDLQRKPAGAEEGGLGSPRLRGCGRNQSETRVQWADQSQPGTARGHHHHHQQQQWKRCQRKTLVKDGDVQPKSILKRCSFVAV
ncbi:uncharacterized protein LOC143280124 [Babylonia areolata]|uniref:uncharacterized protein LOC143280124 n=1 Tax=Babylonia areolata TaxID=304850 RepID=UPI003FD2F903